MRKFGKILSGTLSSAMIVSSLIVPGSSVFADTKVEINEKNFPDQAFRDVITNFDADKNGYFDEKEINDVISITGVELGIKSVKGIEFFDKLLFAFFAENEIDEIDLSKNEELITIDLSFNKLKSIDVSGNTKLENLILSSNEISSIDLSKNSNLVNLNIAENQISSIDLSKNTKIQSVEFMGNPFKSIDVSMLPELIYVNLDGTEISKMDVSKNPKLEALNLGSTKISSIDVSKNPDLKTLSIYQTAVSSLDLSNNFKIENLAISETKLKISDFSMFPNLRSLWAGYLDIDSINVTKNPKLEELAVVGNKLTSIDLSKNPLLCDLVLDDNKLTEINLSNNPELERFDAGDNALTSIDVSKCPKLSTLFVGFNKISSIDLSKNTELQLLNLSGNTGIKSVDLSNNKDLESVYLIGCCLESLDVSKCPNIVTLLVENNNITDINVSNNPKIELLDCSINAITNLDLKSCTGLEVLQCYDNNIKSLDFTGTAISNIGLEYFEGLGYKVGRDNGNSKTEDSFAFFIEDVDSVACEKYGFFCDSKVEITGVKNEYKNPTEIKFEGGKSFVERLYTMCLDREAEKAGVEYWTSELKKGFSGGDLARSFFFSEEFQKQSLSDKEFVERLYGTFMGRFPAPEEVDYWLGEMKSGNDKNFVFDGFVNSPEWATICRDYSIISGGVGEPSYDRAPYKVVRDFAKRLYTTCLGREAEKEGLMYWANEIANLRQTGTLAATNFFFSEEFVNAKYDDKEFVTRLYGTFMDRTPDADGMNYWVDQLGKGVSREDVLMGFSAAPEFSKICEAAGIMR